MRREPLELRDVDQDDHVFKHTIILLFLSLRPKRRRAARLPLIFERLNTRFGAQVGLAANYYAITNSPPFFFSNSIASLRATIAHST
jgi:hypothetical protein